ncbi:FMN-binding protein [Protaetiibacter intestinalis]|uniref:FMN-binding protein n=1 Tax=Protaetiibacter intestinalis TaxID=2419774 RepID=A0A387B583_9MICO|nr:hypothetical protein [Protaetiibacter intestinalis]AYF97467.1 hypothetical protein D7I47_03830 [Protaetiibacter intestinalis]
MTTSPRPHRTLGIAGIAGIGLLSLAGCATASDAADNSSGSGSTDTSASYTDGTYTAEGSYVSPAGQESITVELTLEDDIVTAVTVTPEADDPQAESFQEKFAGGIADVVVGKDIDTLDVSRVAGSSLTSGGFNQALATIKADALES